MSFKKVIKSAGIVLSGNIGSGIFGLLSLSIFTKSQGAELFGYFVIFLVFLEFIDKLFYFQTWPAFIKFASDFQARNENHNVIMLLKFSFLNKGFKKQKFLINYQNFLNLFFFKK